MDQHNAAHTQPTAGILWRYANWLYYALSWLLAGIFLFSGASKLLDSTSFAIIIEAYGLIPEVTVLPIALLLALAEAVVGLGLLLHLRWSLEIITGLIIFFMIILGYGIHLGLDVDCGCFGSGDPEGEALHSLRPALYRDAALLCLTVILFAWRRWAAIKPLTLKQRYHSWNRRRNCP